MCSKFALELVWTRVLVEVSGVQSQLLCCLWWIFSNHTVASCSHRFLSWRRHSSSAVPWLCDEDRPTAIMWSIGALFGTEDVIVALLGVFRWSVFDTVSLWGAFRDVSNIPVSMSTSSNSSRSGAEERSKTGIDCKLEPLHRSFLGSSYSLRSSSSLAHSPKLAKGHGCDAW